MQGNGNQGVIHVGEMACVAAYSDTVYTPRNSTQLFEDAQGYWTAHDYLEEFVVDQSRKAIYVSALTDASMVGEYPPQYI